MTKSALTMLLIALFVAFAIIVLKMSVDAMSEAADCMFKPHSSTCLLR